MGSQQGEREHTLLGPPQITIVVTINGIIIPSAGVMTSRLHDSTERHGNRGSSPAVPSRFTSRATGRSGITLPRSLVHGREGEIALGSGLCRTLTSCSELQPGMGLECAQRRPDFVFLGLY